MWAGYTASLVKPCVELVVIFHEVLSHRVPHPAVKLWHMGGDAVHNTIPAHPAQMIIYIQESIIGKR